MWMRLKIALVVYITSLVAFFPALAATILVLNLIGPRPRATFMLGWITFFLVPAFIGAGTAALLDRYIVKQTDEQSNGAAMVTTCAVTILLAMVIAERGFSWPSLLILTVLPWAATIAASFVAWRATPTQVGATVGGYAFLLMLMLGA